MQTMVRIYPFLNLKFHISIGGTSQMIHYMDQLYVKIGFNKKTNMLVTYFRDTLGS